MVLGASFLFNIHEIPNTYWPAKFESDAQWIGLRLMLLSRYPCAMSMRKGVKVEAFEQHLVPIHFTLEQDGREWGHVVSAFVLEVRDYSFLVSAGHCLREIEELNQSGIRNKRVGLMDSLPESAPFKHLVAYHLVWDEGFWCYEGGGALDYGVLPLEEYRSLLKQNGVLALSDITWGGTPGEIDLYVLLGVVGDLTSSDAHVADKPHGVATIIPIPAVEGDFSIAPIPMFYGKLPKNEENISPRGMSGGPMFAIKIMDGQLRYWLHAIQNQWIPGTREISGCPVFQIADQSICSRCPE